MLENSIGLHLYSLQIRRKRDRDPVPFSDQGAGALLRSAMTVLIKNWSTPMTENGYPRSWFIDTVSEVNDSWSGVIRYGTSGYESEIVDGRTRDVRYNHAITDLDVIPL